MAAKCRLPLTVDRGAENHHVINLSGAGTSVPAAHSPPKLFDLFFVEKTFAQTAPARSLSDSTARDLPLVTDLFSHFRNYAKSEAKMPS